MPVLTRRYINLIGQERMALERLRGRLGDAWLHLDKLFYFQMPVCLISSTSTSVPPMG